MFGSTVLEVMIGLALVYLLLSLVCSTIQEAFAAWLNWRGEMLRKAIARLMADSTGLVTQLYDHALIRALGRTGRDPSYIPNRTFADAVVSLLSGAGASVGVRSAADRLTALEASLQRGQIGATPLPPDLRATLIHALENARDKLGAASASAEAQLEQLKLELDAWFERTMQRATGWYRRKTLGWQFAIALVVVVLTNADTLMITEQLATHPQARAAALQSAVELVKSPQAGAGAETLEGAAATGDARERWLTSRARVEQAVDQFYDTTSRAQLQLGWPDAREGDPKSPEAKPEGRGFWARKLLGLLVTVCAVALGAPFWFQVLEKLVKLRGAGASSSNAKTSEGANSNASQGSTSKATEGSASKTT